MKSGFFAAACMLLMVALSPEAKGDCQNCGPDINGQTSCYDDMSGWSHCVAQGNSCDTKFECGYAGCGCFLSGTMVETKGGLKPIESIRKGEIVLSAAENGHLTYAEVSSTM